MHEALLEKVPMLKHLNVRCNIFMIIMSYLAK